MSTVKEAISRLYSEWSWNEVRLDVVKRDLICKNILVGKGGGISVDVGGLKFKFRHVREDKDFRIFTSTSKELVQWRTSKDKGDRIVVRNYAQTASDRLPIEEYFLDPASPDDGEIIMLEMMYPELTAILPRFPEAMDKVEAELRRMKSW
jgi:hypothetical protein